MSTELTTTIKASLDVYKGKFETKLVEFKKTHAGLVYKMEEEEQRTKARADRREVNKVIKELDEEHDTIKAPFLEASRIVDATRKNIKDEFNLLSNGIGDQLKAHDAKIQEKLDHISLQAEIDRGSSVQIQAIIEATQAIEIDDSFCDKKADAALLKEQTLQKLQGLLEQAGKDEELERLRKESAEREAKEREEKIARDAAEKARIEAEAKAKEEENRKERERQDAAAKAAREQEAKEAQAAQAIKDAEDRAESARQEERDKIEQEQRKEEEAALIQNRDSMISHINDCAIGIIGGEMQPIGLIIYELEKKVVIDSRFGKYEDDLERQRLEAIQKVKALQLKIDNKQKAEQDAEDAKKAKQTHRAKIHKQAKESLIANGIEEKQATKIVELIRDGEIKNVEVIY